MVTKSRKARIIESISFGLFCGVGYWLLHYIPWFREGDNPWWRNVAFGCGMAIVHFFYIGRLRDRERERKER